MVELINNYWAVEVPSMAFGFDVNNYGNESEYMYMLSMEDIADDSNHEETLITKPLPLGTWKIICTSKEATEEQAKQIVERVHPGGFGRSGEEFRDYMRAGVCFSPTSSLKTLLTAKGCDLNKSYLIIKKG